MLQAEKNKIQTGMDFRKCRLNFVCTYVLQRRIALRRALFNFYILSRSVFQTPSRKEIKEDFQALIDSLIKRTNIDQFVSKYGILLLFYYLFMFFVCTSSTGLNSTEQRRVEQNRTKQNRIKQHSMAQHSIQCDKISYHITKFHLI